MGKLSRLQAFFRKSVYFLRYDIWRTTDDEITAAKNHIYSTIKIFLVSIRGFMEDKILAKSAALTYYTLFSVVPILALVIAVGKGFGVQYYLQEQFIYLFPGHAEVLNEAFVLVDSYIQQIQGGVFLGVGFLLLFWSVITVFSEIDVAFNDIWHIKKLRNTFRRFADYFSMMLVLPILLIVSSGLSIYLNSSIQDIYFSSLIMPVWYGFLKVLPFLINIVIFTLMYLFFPNTKVRFSAALLAGIVAGVLFQLFQLLYISGQIWISYYNAIYGSFAAFPLLLLWLWASWAIILYGAEFAFAAQNIKNYEFEADVKTVSRRYENFLYILVVSVIVKRFEKKETALTAEQLSTNHKIPFRLVNRIINKLLDAGIIIEVLPNDKSEDITFQPAIDINQLTIAYLFQQLENLGSENFKIDTIVTYTAHWQAMLSSQLSAQEYSSSVLLKDL
ncbi:MAG: YihY/virulence factor BrkB family protein [Paludibacteraceae bacterium]|nr:YihY/virulence factor BrkB family protein [Paludibacteraceae bacterium]MBP6284483.1 YihY/virulence factor BrkB family protein [Paludibacteraceae bacterium]